VPGMFATLVLVLPSMSTGGELVVRHKGREVRLDLRCEDPSEVAFAGLLCRPRARSASCYRGLPIDPGL
jgi:hypothetical protein